MSVFQTAFTYRKLLPRVVLGSLFCASATNGISQQPLKTLIVGVDHRQTQSLNGNWHYLVEQPPARELYDDTGSVRDTGYAQNTHPNISSGPHNSEYDFSVAPTLKVPGDWNTQDPTLFRFEASCGTSVTSSSSPR